MRLGIQPSTLWDTVFTSPVRRLSRSPEWNSAISSHSAESTVANTSPRISWFTPIWIFAETRLVRAFAPMRNRFMLT